MGNIYTHLYTKDVDDDEDQFEGGTEKTADEKEKELTPEEKAEKAKKLEIATAKAKEMLYGYIGQFKILMFFGFTLNILGMIGEFVSPLFIGWVIDAIVASDQGQVRNLIMWWMIFNTTGAFFAGLQRYVFQILTEKIGQALR
jgi:ABC-type bacteriocin/lantibiotic exporter with double-glycine peptidase domain